MITLIGLLVGYWLLMIGIPVPNFGAGAIDTADGNLAAFIDQQILSGHMWKEAWDPEGLLSTLPAIGTTLIGIWTGRMLMSDKESESSRTLQFFIWGFILIIIGYIWSWVFPINKNIWTSSYTLFTGGQAMCIFGLCYWFLDVKEKQRFTNWGVAFGINAITVFFLSGVIARVLSMITFNYGNQMYSIKGWIYEVVLKSVASPINASILYAIIWIILFWGLARWMQKKNIIIKV